MGISMDNRLKECTVVTKDTALGYTHRVIVAGSRKYNDYAFFKSFMKEYFIDDPLYTNNLCFISGMAFSGGDDLIITFCKEFNIPIYPCAAEWRDSNNNYDSSAGFKRNLTMLDVGNQLVAFYDGKSNGTKHILDNAGKIKMKRVIVKIEIHKE